MRLRTTLEQWTTLRAIDECGSIQAASAQLNKSHTTLIYSIKKLEEQLGLVLLEVRGRKAVLTKDGKTVLRHASSMLEQAENLEVISSQLSKGTESEMTVTIDHLCDREILYRALNEFVSKNVTTSVQIVETSLTSTVDTVLSQKSDVAIINLPVINFPAEALGVVTMVPIVSKNHSLVGKSDLVMGDLTKETQIVLRDLGTTAQTNSDDDKSVGWLKSKRRITVDTFDQAMLAVKRGLGFTRIPQHLFDQYSNGELVQLEIQGANYYQVPIHITLPKGLGTGPAALQLYDLIIREAKRKELN